VAYAEKQVAISRAVELPLLKHFAHMTESEIVAVGQESNSSFLLAAEENTLREKLLEDLNKWFSDKMSVLKKEEIVAEDITLMTFVRKKVLSSFLPLYTSDIQLATAIMSEIDQYGVASDTASMNVYLDALRETIEEELKKKKDIVSRLKQSELLLLRAQEIANLGHWTWDLTTGKIAWSENLYNIYGMQQGADLDFDDIITYIDPSEQARIKAELKQSIIDVEPRETYFHIALKDGTKKTLYGRTLPMADEHGLAIRLEGIVQDVTEREALIEQLEQNEALYKQAQAMSHIGNWWWNLADNKVTWSDELYRIYGLEPGSVDVWDVLGKYYHPDDKAVPAKALKEAIEQYRPYDVEFRIIDHNGVEKVLHSKGDVDEAAGLPIAMYGTVQDITEQKKSERQLKEYKEFIEKIANVTPSMIATYNILGKYTFINKAFEKLLGYPVSRPMKEGLPFTTSIVHPEDLPGIRVRYGKALEEANRLPPGEDEPVVEFKHRMRNSSGVYRWFYTYGTVFERNKVNKVVSMLSISVDITDQEIAEQSLGQKNLELQQSNKSLEEYAYVASHDMKEPLRKIATFSDMVLRLQKGTLSPESKPYLDKIIASAKRMQGMVDDLLAVATITGNKAFEECDLNEVLIDAMVPLDHKIDELGAKIESDELPKVPVVCLQFRQLFQNLISNSLKFARSGVAPHISIHSSVVDRKAVEHLPISKADSFLKIVFTDNGIGFDDQYAENIFAIFKRLHGKEVYEGTGIGLAICKKIVENHNGVIYAHGIPDEGATFTIVIPMQQ
jgi:PAS domain S-box-containing protein